MTSLNFKQYVIPCPYCVTLLEFKEYCRHKILDPLHYGRDAAQNNTS